jgi:hypothetical protein
VNTGALISFFVTQIKVFMPSGWLFSKGRSLNIK